MCAHVDTLINENSMNRSSANTANNCLALSARLLSIHCIEQFAVILQFGVFLGGDKHGINVVIASTAHSYCIIQYKT